MIITSAELTDEIVADVSVCIVGSGAAGITLACELDGGGHKVLLLEAGSLKSTKAYQDYYAGFANAPHPASDEYRRVAFGGTTSIWGGRCVPFDPIDFERRDYVSESGWPIGYAEVSQYYARALEYCDAGKFDFTAAGSITGARPTISGLVAGSEMQWDLIERYSLPTNFAARYGDQLRSSSNITTVLDARCVKLIKVAAEDRIESIEIATIAGSRRRIRARVIVLAMGGIETTRLLLSSDPQGSGYGNRTDRLGRFYGCHLETTFGKLVPHGARVAFDFEKTSEGVYCRRKFQFTAAAQRQHQLLNTAFRFHFPEYSDAAHGSSVLSAIYLAKSLLIPEYRNILQHDAVHAVFSPASAHLKNVLCGVPQMSRFGIDWVFRRHLAKRKLPYTLVANADGSFPLEFNCEQTPLASSRITLAPEVDVHGMKRVRIDWRRSDEDIDSARRAFVLLRAAFSESSVCRLEFEEERLLERISRASPVGGHHIGTTRMASSMREGVVDTNCALFDFPNVYIASSSVFPTGSHANPTLTIVALTLRMASHLRSKLATVS
jgi:choline dehydrogenase-like flavoprotein